MKKRIVMFLLSGLLLLLTASSLCLSTAADDAVGSLTLDCTVAEGQTRTAVAGDTFALVKVADGMVNEFDNTYDLSYSVTERFADYDCNWNALSASQLHEKAKAIAGNVNAQDYVDIKTTDSRGKAVFELAEAGLYLVVRTATQNADITFDAYLISVPQYSNGEINYDVVSSPKFGVGHIKEEITPDNGGRLPQTGQLHLPVIILAAAGVGMITVGIRLMRSGKKHEEV